MLVEWDAWPPPRREPPEPPSPREPRLAKRDERLVVWLVGIALLAWFLSPIAGGTLVEALAALVRG